MPTSPGSPMRFPWPPAWTLPAAVLAAACLAVSWPASPARGEMESGGFDELVDVDAESMKFRFRTRFDRAYDADASTRVLVARKVSVPPVLDGIMEDECWKGEGPQSEWKHRTHSAWVQIVTTNVTPKQTVLYACYDDRNLYFAYAAEEPEPKSVLFIEKRSPGDEHGYEAYNGDCGELFIETDGLGGDGHGWQFIFNIYNPMFYDGTNPYTGEGTTWRSGARCKGAMGPKCWIVEIAAPFEGFRFGTYAYQGPPKRGERWGLRVVRDGRPPPTGEDRILSTWTYNPVESWHNPWPTGTLIFDDPNLLRNGRLNEDLDNDGKLDHWSLKKSRDTLAADLAFDREAGFGAVTLKPAEADDLFQVSQTVGVRPNKFYRLTGKLRIEKGLGKVTVGFDQPARSAEVVQPGEWQDVDLEMYASAAQQEVSVYLLVQGGVERLALDHLTLVQEPFGIEKGVYCLTGNSFRPELNVRATWNVQGRYTYREPGTAEFKPPYRKQWTPLVANGYDDEGAASAADGWIAFEKGSLTRGGHNIVQWPWPPTHLLSPTYPQGHELIFDLGRDFFVTGIDSLFAMSIRQMQVYVKPEKAEDFVLVDKLNGAGVLDPPGEALYYRARGLNSVARTIKLHWYEATYQGGAQFFCQLWGTEKGSHGDLEITRFRWKKGITVEKPPVPAFYRIREPFIVPQPQEVQWTDPAYVLNPSTRIVCAEEGLTPGIGQDFSDDTFEMHQVRLPVTLLSTELQANPALKDCIVIGDVASSSRIESLAREAGLDVTADRPGPQGYVLSVDADRVLIIGSGDDQSGAFYGVTSVMQILGRDAAGRRRIPGCRIRDWPQALRRDTMFHFQEGIRLSEEYETLLKLYSLIRINATTGELGLNPYSPEQMKVYHRLRDFARRHFITQGFLGSASRSAGQFLSTEMGDDEDAAYLQEKTDCSRLNICPSSSHGYYALRNALQGAVSESVSEAEVSMLNIDEMGHIKDGSRWNADRRCQRRNLEGWRLFYEYICRYYDLCRRQGVKVEAIDTMLTRDAGNERFHNMGYAYPYIPHDMIMGSWKGSIGVPESNPEYAVDHFERVITWNTWGFNGNYGDPYGGPSPNFRQTTPRRIWGTRSSWWGRSSNEGHVIGLLAKIVGGQCMAGSLQLAVESEYLWSPARPMPNTFEFVNRLVNLTVRLNERYFRRPFPSWEEDRQPRWLLVDLQGVANWSPIDDLPADNQGWLDWGSNYDLRLMPRGDVRLEEVPFRLPDPRGNGGRSIVFLANYPADAKLAPALPSRCPDIPIGRKVASLCFLKMRVGGGIPPSTVANYEDGRRLTFNLDVRDLEVAGTYTWDRPHHYEDMPHYGKSIGLPNPLATHIDFLSRPGWLGYTASGDECSARIHEWVNPYPELAIQSISLFYPSCQNSEERTALLAITGIEAEERDVARWAGRERPPLRPPQPPVSLEGLKPLIAGGRVEVLEIQGARKLGHRATNRYLDAQGQPTFTVEGADEGGRLFADDARSCLLRGVSSGKTQWSVTVQFAQPATVEAIALRGRFMTYKYGGNVAAGSFNLARADYRLHAHLPDGSWRPVGECLAACGEDDTCLLPVPSLTINQVRIDVDVARYSTDYYGDANCPGVSFFQAYTR
ncbi:MAG: hypothetical protein HYU36_10525 [Planctomycetes bacterium]|nr:hypothetical protein [Planctomycetota bacterium]